MSESQQRRSSSSWTGIFLIIVGVLFLLDTLHILDLGYVFNHWWPVILILIGVFNLRSSQKTSGVLFIIVGVVLLAATLHIISWESISALWPILLILVGVYILWGRRKVPSHKDLHAETAETVNARTVFGGLERRIKSSNFRGGVAEAIFGGVELDFRGSQLAPEGADLDLSATFGGVDVTVPADWKVLVTGTPIVGGLDNKTDPPESDAGKQVLRCHCNVLFGGVEIKY